MVAEDRKLATDVFAWTLNVVTSVLVIFITKILMVVYHFNFATTICGVHFLSCAFAIWIVGQLGWVERASIPFKYTLLFSVVGSISIASANLSLLLNSVGFYQIAKLLLAPFVCMIEIVWLGKRFTVSILLSIAAVLAGVAVVTITDVAVQPVGVIMAVTFIISSGLQQILCGQFQSKFSVSAHQLLANTSPVQGTMLLLAGPFMDHLVTGRWINQWDINVPALQVLAVSCAVAIAVNLSQFLCLGRFSATSFQVLGHAKTVLVLLGGWLLFKENINMKQLSGMGLAVAGMIAYSYLSSWPAAPVKSPGLTAQRPPVLPVLSSQRSLQLHGLSSRQSSGSSSSFGDLLASAEQGTSALAGVVLAHIKPPPSKLSKE